MFDEERRRVDAWAKVFATDGFEAAQEAERAEIALIRKEKDDNDLKNFKAFEKLMREGKAVKEARERERKAALGIEDDGSDQENVSSSNNTTTNNSTVNPFSGETILPTKETPALTAIREQRLADALSGKTSQMVEEAINKKHQKTDEISCCDTTTGVGSTEEEYDNKAEWTKCHIVEELDDDDDEEENVTAAAGVGMKKGAGDKEAPISIDLNDIDVDDEDSGDGQEDGYLLDGVTPEQSSLSLLAALDQSALSSNTTAGAPVGTDLFELD